MGIGAWSDLSRVAPNCIWLEPVPLTAAEDNICQRGLTALVEVIQMQDSTYRPAAHMPVASRRGTFWNRNAAVRRLLRSTAAIALVGATITVCRRLPRVDVTSTALILLLVILAIAIRWGWAEAIVAAVAGSLALDYFFLPPHGFRIENPEHLVAFFTFLATAIAAGQLSARANRHRAEAVKHRLEIENLHRLSDALSECDGEEAIFGRLAGSLLDILAAEAVAVYDKARDHVWRAGAWGEDFAFVQLREAAASGNRSGDPDSAIAIVPVRVSGQLAGSAGVAGAAVSPEWLMAVMEYAGTAIAKARAAENARQAEIVRRSEELKSAIFDALAHEARGPLSSIDIAASTLLSERPGSVAQQREMLGIILEEVGRMNRWIDETARLIEADAGELALHQTPQDVGGLVSSALEPFRPLLRGRLIRVDIPPALPMAGCDRAMVERVLKLLLDNALKYSPPGSPVAISSGLDGAMILVTVADAGARVPEDERELIFEKHYRGGHTNVPGTGLGLASAKHLVEAQGGEIWVTNRPAGGAVFHFSLPAAIGVPV